MLILSVFLLPKHELKPLWSSQPWRTKIDSTCSPIFFCGRTYAWSAHSPQSWCDWFSASDLIVWSVLEWVCWGKFHYCGGVLRRPIHWSVLSTFIPEHFWSHLSVFNVCNDFYSFRKEHTRAMQRHYRAWRRLASVRCCSVRSSGLWRLAAAWCSRSCRAGRKTWRTSCCFWSCWPYCSSTSSWETPWNATPTRWSSASSSPAGCSSPGRATTGPRAKTAERSSTSTTRRGTRSSSHKSLLCCGTRNGIRSASVAHRNGHSSVKYHPHTIFVPPSWPSVTRSSAQDRKKINSWYIHPLCSHEPVKTDELRLSTFPIYCFSLTLCWSFFLFLYFLIYGTS